MPSSMAQHAKGDGAWVATYNRAVDLYNDYDAEGCVRETEALLEDPDRAGRRLGRSLYWECAMYRGWYATAGELLVRSIHEGTHPVQAATQHASTLSQVGRPEEALAWLDLFPQPDKTSWRKTRLRLLAKLQRWDDIAALAEEEADPRLKSAAAITLAGVGRTEVARPLLEAACAAMEDDATRSSCEDKLARVPEADQGE